MQKKKKKKPGRTCKTYILYQITDNRKGKTDKSQILDNRFLEH